MAGDNEAPGWDAIDEALRSIYGDTKALHWAPAVPGMLGGNDPLDGISVYRSECGGAGHWHFITYGFSELFAKESDDPAVSGFGFEMTMRVIDPEHIDTPPTWALSVLQNLARYVFKTGNVFAPGHHLTLNGPIALGRKTDIVAAAFAHDAQLLPIDTPYGHLEFVQLVGLTDDEYQAARAWNTSGLLDLLRTVNPALVTDLARTSVLANPELKRRAVSGAALEGASMSTIFASRGSLSIEAGRTFLGVAANALGDLRAVTRGRFALGRTVDLVWPEGAVRLSPTPGESVVALTDEDLDAIDRIPEQRGDYLLPSGLTIRVLPVEIRDGEGKQVIKVVG